MMQFYFLYLVNKISRCILNTELKIIIKNDSRPEIVFNDDRLQYYSTITVILD